jgi:hypothetical protein
MQRRPARIVTKEHKLSVRFSLFSAFPQDGFNACMVKFRTEIDGLRPGNGAYQAHGRLPRSRSVRTPNNIWRIAPRGQSFANGQGRFITAFIKRALMIG